MDGVLLAFFGARVVPVAVVADWHFAIGLLDAAEHFLVNGLAERFESLGHCLRVRILRFEVLDDIRVALVLDPEVIVRARFAVQVELVRNDLGSWRRGRGGILRDRGTGQ